MNLSLWFPPRPMMNSLLNTLYGSDESETLIALNSLAHLPNHNEVNMPDNYFNSSRLTETWSVYGGQWFFSHINAFEVYSPVGFPLFPLTHKLALHWQEFNSISLGTKIHFSGPDSYQYMTRSDTRLAGRH